MFQWLRSLFVRRKDSRKKDSSLFISKETEKNLKIVPMVQIIHLMLNAYILLQWIAGDSHIVLGLIHRNLLGSAGFVSRKMYSNVAAVNKLFISFRHLKMRLKNYASLVFLKKGK